MFRSEKSIKFSKPRLFLAVVALLSLLLSGGTYTHAHTLEIGAQNQVHSAASVDDQGDASQCPFCKPVDRSIFCDANIQMIAAEAGLDHPVLAPQASDVRFAKFAGRLLVPEPPPPRMFPVFEM